MPFARCKGCVPCCSTMIGTHTHMPTADACILSGGTAYITDVGMTGGKESIIGFSKEDFLGFFLGRRSPIGASGGPAVLSAVVDVRSKATA